MIKVLLIQDVAKGVLASPQKKVDIMSLKDEFVAKVIDTMTDIKITGAAEKMIAMVTTRIIGVGEMNMTNIQKKVAKSCHQAAGMKLVNKMKGIKIIKVEDEEMAKVVIHMKRNTDVGKMNMRSIQMKGEGSYHHGVGMKVISKMNHIKMTDVDEGMIRVDLTKIVDIGEMIMSSTQMKVGRKYHHAAGLKLVSKMKGIKIKADEEKTTKEEIYMKKNIDVVGMIMRNIQMMGEGRYHHAEGMKVKCKTNQIKMIAVAEEMIMMDMMKAIDVGETIMKSIRNKVARRCHHVEEMKLVNRMKDTKITADDEETTKVEIHMKKNTGVEGMNMGSI
mmetsp:Transcript_18947/g.28591  ORF Transcript_18947/g.28591 Transcript_18947/m.28591 type:complete len:333 (+) Transcript_18947:63-1061(+)